jgi:AraC-like DNA-binding protein
MSAGKQMRAGGAAGVLDAVTARGGSSDRVLAAAGLAPDELADADRLLDVDRIMALFEAAARETGDGAFGLHLGTTYDYASIGPLVYAVLNAPTVGVALGNFARYGRSFVQGGAITIARADTQVEFGYALDVADFESCRQHVEGAAVVTLRVLRRLIGPDWQPRLVRFGHAEPSDTTEHRRLLGVPMRFRESIPMSFAFDADVLERSVPGADRRLLPIVERHLQELLAGAPSVLDDVRHAIAEALCDGAPTIRVVAKRLGTSVRTLQRRLGAEGGVFTTLVEDVRRDVAMRYLADGKANLTDIAFLTGYSELSAFGRAFRRWTGSTPLAVRKQLLARSGGVGR